MSRRNGKLDRPMIRTPPFQDFKARGPHATNLIARDQEAVQPFSNAIIPHPSIVPSEPTIARHDVNQIQSRDVVLKNKNKVIKPCITSPLLSQLNNGIEISSQNPRVNRRMLCTYLIWDHSNCFPRRSIGE